MSGNADWSVTSSTSSSGTHSLKSGSIFHSQTSCVSVTQTTVVGVYSFYYRTSSDSTDYLKFYLDGSVIKTASGSSSFTKYSDTVSSAGSHTFKWCYEKDSTTSDGSDAVWIDEIVMPLEIEIFSSVSAGQTHTCAIDNSSAATCWGKNSYGELGNGSTSTIYAPVSVDNISTATSVSTGDGHTCALLSGGTVKCWGRGTSGQLGNGSTSTKYAPVSVDNISLATAVSVGDSHSCALLSGGTVKCWGYGNPGQLGNGSTGDQSTPIAVSDISTAIAVSAGERHTCALLSGGTIKCWGYGSYGQLGYSSSGISSQTTPVSVSGISTAVSVSTGYNHTCALLSNGTIMCWGFGDNGQLGIGSSSNKTTPVSVSGISTATSVSAGGYHTCALLSGGTVKCWGRGSSGQLGYSSSGISDQYTPVSVSGVSTATAVSLGAYHTCAVLSGGSIKCWGYGTYGQLGYGSSGNQYTPVIVDPLFTDQAGPTGSFVIKTKPGYSTGTWTVSFTLTAADSTAIVAYYLSTSASTPSSSSSSWTSVSETISLSATVSSSKYLYSGNNNFYVWYKDVLGNISSQYSDSMYCNSSTCY